MGKRKKDLIALKGAGLRRGSKGSTIPKGRGGKPAKPDAKTSLISYGRGIPNSTTLPINDWIGIPRSKTQASNQILVY